MEPRITRMGTDAVSRMDSPSKTRGAKIYKKQGSQLCGPQSCEPNAIFRRIYD